MGLETFELPNGSAGDVAELEYISALHQTGVEDTAEGSEPHENSKNLSANESLTEEDRGRNLRLDGSVNARDIRLFLASRYGIIVTEDQVKSTVMQGLGGDGDGLLDLVEIVACLMIPMFLKLKEQQLGNPLDQFVVEANPELVQNVLKTMLEDVTGSEEIPELSNDLVISILRSYGEHELAEDSELMTEMVKACSSDRLDKHSLAAALTYDTHLLDIANEGSLSPSLVDVLTKETDDTDESDNVLERALDEESDFRHFATQLEQEKTYSHIDVTAGNFRSKFLIVLLWVTFAISYFAFSFEPLHAGLDRMCFDEDAVEQTGFTPWSERSTAIACESIISILLWLVYFIGLAVLGLIFISAGSTGNSVYCKDWRQPLLGAAVFVPIIILFYARGKAAGPFLGKVSVLLAFVTAFLHMSHAAYLGWPRFREFVETNHEFLASSVYEEMRLKTSAARKLNLMVENAFDVFKKSREGTFAEQGSNYSKVLQSYARHGQRTKTVGGLIWAWKRLLGFEDGHLKDGIWISTRLLASNISQYIVVFYLLIAGVILLKLVATSFDSEFPTKRVKTFSLGLLYSDPETTYEAVRNAVTFARILFNKQVYAGVDFGCDGFSLAAEKVLEQHCFSSGTGDLYDLVCDQDVDDATYICAFLSDESLTLREQIALLTGSGIDDSVRGVTESLVTVVERATENAINSIYPSEQYMLTVPIAIATFFCFLTTGYLAISYIPSVMYTMLKLRSGVIPSLRDPRFFKFREAPDLVAILTGSIFWGTLGSGLVVGIIAGLFVFFFLWQATAYYSQRFFAIVIGFLGVTLLRVLFLQSRRKLYFRSWYRERPGQANLVMLALEWAYFSLSMGFIFFRLFKLLLCAAFNVGRIDTPFLAPGVGRIATIELDHYHFVHVQDILAHEAHRHPYMELLGLIYMMKLRHGEKFGTSAGSTWRLIFVHALFPWLHQYRVQARLDIAGGIQDTGGSLVRAQSSMFWRGKYEKN